MKKILILLFILCSCSSNSQVIKPSFVDEEFKPYVQEFKLIIKNPKYDNRVKNITIIFTDIPSAKKGYKTLAYCNMMFTENPVIYVDRSYYYSATPMSQQFTLLHEMGHCVCNRFHTENSEGIAGFLENILFKLGIATKKGYLSDGCPASILHPYEFSESCMMSHYFYYIEEFQKGCN